MSDRKILPFFILECICAGVSLVSVVTCAALVVVSIGKLRLLGVAASSQLSSGTLPI